MHHWIKNVIRSSLAKVNVGITRYSTLESLYRSKTASRDLDLLLKLPRRDGERLLEFFGKSSSQLGQDIFVLSVLGFKENGFFVEFGAADGVRFSNTFLMERMFKWNGVLAEPAVCWYDRLKKNRMCAIDTRCVWRDSTSKLLFNEVDIPELSTIDSFSNIDMHSRVRKLGRKYLVDTITLDDLLDHYGCPRQIDYISIDTEGSEYEILKSFPFEKYDVTIFTVEHNYSPGRENVFNLLFSKGYRRVLEDLSCFDDWYIRSDIKFPL